MIQDGGVKLTHPVEALTRALAGSALTAFRYPLNREQHPEKVSWLLVTFRGLFASVCDSVSILCLDRTRYAFTILESVVS